MQTDDREIKENEAMEAMKKGNATGSDGLTAEMVKNLGRSGTEILTVLYSKNMEWRQCTSRLEKRSNSLNL